MTPSPSEAPAPVAATSPGRRIRATMLFSLLFHLLFTWSVFDIYFTSPVVHPGRHFGLNDTYMVLPSQGIPKAKWGPNPWASWKQNDPIVFGSDSQSEAKDQPHDPTDPSSLTADQLDELIAEGGENADAMLQMLVQKSKDNERVRVGGFMNMEVYRDLQPPAKRLVLLVGDGLRADTLFKHHPWASLPAWAQQDLKDQVGSGHRQLTDYASALLTDKKTELDAESVPSKSESLLSDLHTAAPFLNNVACERGAWGLSHTRVPTESRPGHVALIAGMYEDVSAVTKGWKTNPIPFDSVLNQSTHTYSFGSPDILPMFAQGAASAKVDMWTYREEDEDFTKDATHLDLWVLDQLNGLFARARENRTLCAELKRPGTVFFLHLLGLDTTGHTFGPASVEYVGNTIVVDAIARRVEEAMSTFFEDEDTAYVFTADHGMSNKGNHGDGDPDNTRTPLVAWGAGIRGPIRLTQESLELLPSHKAGEPDEYYADWRAVERVYRSDVEQADVTALMTGLLGSPFPGNSEGRLPVDYLRTSREYAVRSMLANALEVLEMYRTKHALRAGRTIGYKEYAPLRDVNSAIGPEEGDDPDLPGDQMVYEAKYFILAEEYEEAVTIIRDIVSHSLEGIRYLQHYDWPLLATLIVAGYVASILNGIAFLVSQYGLSAQQYQEAAPTATRSHHVLLSRVIPVLGFLLLAVKFTVEEAPSTYFFYAAATAALWSLVLTHLSLFKAILSAHVVKRILSAIIPIFVLLETIVIGYLVRISWTVGFILIGVFWPLLMIGPATLRKNPWSWLAWSATCLSNSLFTLETLDKKESVPILIGTGLLFFVAILVVLKNAPAWINNAGHPEDLTRARRVLVFELIALVAATVFTAISSSSLQAKKGLPFFSQVGSWTVLLSCLTVPFLYGFVSRNREPRQPPIQRIVITVFAFAPVFILLSIRDEGLFFASFTLSLVAWSRVEALLFVQRPSSQEKTHSGIRMMSLQDTRVALFFLFFLHAGFFGTGNIASISSFYLPPVYRLVPVFSPFLMTALLLLKIVVPLVLLCAAFQVMCISPRHKTEDTKSQPSSELRKVQDSGLELGSASPLVLATGLATDALALNFFFAIKTEGSWLEIGQTITHFVLANLLQVFMLALTAVTSAMFLGTRQKEHVKTQ